MHASVHTSDVARLRLCVAEQTSREEEVVDPALYASFVDEGDGASEDLARPPPPLAEEGPIVASSGIHFLQYIGKYLLLMVILPPHHTLCSSKR